jgi:hypothetical protein
MAGRRTSAEDRPEGKKWVACWASAMQGPYIYYPPWRSDRNREGAAGSKNHGVFGEKAWTISSSMVAIRM